MELGLAGRTYLITGASRGLGRATATELVADGANVVISSRSAGSVEAAVAELGEEHAAGVVGDNASPDLAEQLVATALDRFGAVNGALVSVGGPTAGPLGTISDHQWREAFDTVFLGALRIARTTAEAIAGDGAIAFVLSTTVLEPNHTLAVSNGLRPGLAMVAKSLADEWGPRGITVNCLLPGRVDTERVQELDALTDNPDETRRRASEGIPVGRYGRPEEFGKAAAYLLSPAAAYINGVALPVDGGASRRV